ncbi:hypothetical protein [Desulfitobacterium sp. AusDCA]|uniref:hypothetical protein n=1 Tax=Desulfitobacterium sp. AusDCA TaxID=3240383 RepID=UPI003DA745FB
MFEFIRKSPLGFVLGATALVLTVSPEARQATRRLAVKGTAVLLDLIDQARSTAALSAPQNGYPSQSLLPYNQGQTPSSDRSSSSINTVGEPDATS